MSLINKISTIHSTAQFGLNLGPLGINFGDAPDPHGPVNPTTAPSLMNSDFIPDAITSMVTPIMDIVGLLAQSGPTTAQSSTIANVTTAIRNGELIQPAFDSAQIATVLSDQSSVFTKAKSDHFLERRDMLSHATWSRVPMIINTIDFNESFTTPAILYKESVMPTQSVGPADATTPYRISPLEFLARNHAFWSGGLRYRLEFVGPRESTVRIAVSFLYGEYPTTDPTYEGSIQFPVEYYTFDSEKRDFTFEVNDIAVFRHKIRYDLVNLGDPLRNLRTSLGTLVIWQVTGVSGINIPLTGNVYFNIWKSGASDFNVYKFSPTPNMSYISAPPPPPFRARVSSFEMGEEQSAVDASMGNLPGAELAVLAPSTAAADLESAGTVLEAAAPQTEPVLNAKKMIHYTTTEPVEVQKLPAKFISLATYNLDTASSGTALGTYSMPADFNKAQAGLIISTGRYFRGDLRVRFTPTAGAFSAGLVFATFLPYGVYETDFAIERLSTLPHAEINLVNNKPIDLFIPYTYAYDYFSMPDVAPIVSDGLPEYGKIVIWCQRFIKPSTGAKPTTLIAQYRWENLKPYIPFTVPACVGDPLSYRAILTTFAQSGGAVSISGNNMAGIDAPTNHLEQNNKVAIAPLAINKVPANHGTFATEFHRPVIYAAQTVTIASNSRAFFNLEPINQPPGSTYLSNSIFDQLKACFASFVGDTQFDIIVRATDTNEIGVSVGSIVSDANPTIVGLLPQIPLPYGATDLYPGRLGAVAPTNSYVVGSQLPLTTFQVPGKIRVVLPFLCQTRYAPASTWSSGIPPDTLIQGYLALWNPTTSPITLSIEIWRTPMPGTRLGHFVGLPPVYFDSLRNVAGTTTQQYSGTNFVLP
jgi:hypothetical protein